jgi:hypothetical protein
VIKGWLKQTEKQSEIFLKKDIPDFPSTLPLYSARGETGTYKQMDTRL